MSAVKSWHSFGKEVFEQCRELVECPLPSPPVWRSPLLLCFVLPAVLSVIFCEIERKLGWIKEGDLKLN